MVLKHGLRLTLAAALVMTIEAACGSSVPAPGTDQPTVSATTPPTAQAESGFAPTLAVETPAAMPAPAGPLPQTERVFTVAVIVDLQSEAVKFEQAQAVVDEAGAFLQRLSSIDMRMIDFVEDGGGGSTNDMASRYVGSHTQAEPNGLVIFSFGDGGRAKMNGGYGYAISGPTGFRNAFLSPVAGSGQIYVAVVQLSHKYAACGYGGSDAVRSSVALGQECGNRPGTACIPFNGYSMCGDSVGHLYASSPTHFASSTIVHELLHPFSPGGDRDHYDTPECNARMGYPEQYHDLQEAQYHNDLCPYVYDEFARSFQP